MAVSSISSNPCLKNNIETQTLLPTGTYTCASDGYVCNETTSIAALIQGANSGSGFYLYGQERLFVRKGMKIRVDSANAVYWLPLT